MQGLRSKNMNVASSVAKQSAVKVVVKDSLKKWDSTGCMLFCGLNFGIYGPNIIIFELLSSVPAWNSFFERKYFPGARWKSFVFLFSEVTDDSPSTFFLSSFPKSLIVLATLRQQVVSWCLDFHDMCGKHGRSSTWMCWQFSSKTRAALSLPPPPLFSVVPYADHFHLHLIHFLLPSLPFHPGIYLTL